MPEVPGASSQRPVVLQPAHSGGGSEGRKRLEIWREKTITLACHLLSIAFDLPRRLRGKAVPQLADLPLNSRVALIKPCCLGDVLLATATIGAIAEARPDLSLEFVVSRWARPPLPGNPHLARLIPTGVDGSVLNWRKYWQLARRLRREKYAAALVLDRSPRLNLLPWLAGIPVRAGVDNLYRGFALNVRATQGPQLQHEAEVYLDVARALGVKPRQPRLEYHPPEGTPNPYASLNLDPARPLAVIHPGGGQNPDTQVLSKRWPAERFGEIAARLIQKGWQVVILGAANDRAAAAELSRTAEKALNDAERALLINACGKFDFAASGALLTHAKLFVGNDTGFMHLAVACGAAVVAIFGPSSPIAYGPYTSRGRTVAPVREGMLAGLPLKEYQALSVAEGGITSVSVEAAWEQIETLISDLSL
ncbi:MAG TPA: lipopolysaccharide heptosyltransferase II [Chloroflexia bacterium]|nr:lipopolysaccharide heptosyltransferase II [Chloroflexia bacterium]